LFVGWYEDNWYEVNLEKENIPCSREEMRAAAEGHITTEALMWNQNTQRTISGMVIIDFLKRHRTTNSSPIYFILHVRMADTKGLADLLSLSAVSVFFPILIFREKYMMTLN